ncbi:MAG: fe-s oxidoreductase [Nocardioides sp.]|nr:fe-s oxidoreductase [Nocardioides sp.]
MRRVSVCPNVDPARLRAGSAGVGPSTRRVNAPGRRGSDDGEGQEALAGGADLDLGAHLGADTAVVAGGPAAVLDLDVGGAVGDREGVDVAWYTTREREQAEVLPWDHLDSGLDKDWLWEDWQDALDETEVEDCRWTPCFDCGVCPQLDTSIQIGPTGKTLLPIAAVTSGLA